MHSDMKCTILVESICLADIHETMTPIPFFALDLMSDVEAAVNRSAIEISEKKSQDSL